MRKFFFDDVRSSPGPDWTVARSVPEAQEVLAFAPFDVMSLDHDIGFQMMCPTCLRELDGPVIGDSVLEKLRDGCAHKLTGTTLAKWMVATAGQPAGLVAWPELILIHSANPYGAARMAGLLDPYADVRIIPYHAIKYDRIVMWEVEG